MKYLLFTLLFLFTLHNAYGQTTYENKIVQITDRYKTNAGDNPAEKAKNMQKLVSAARAQVGKEFRLIAIEGLSAKYGCVEYLGCGYAVEGVFIFERTITNQQTEIEKEVARQVNHAAEKIMNDLVKQINTLQYEQFGEAFKQDIVNRLLEQLKQNQ